MNIDADLLQAALLGLELKRSEGEPEDCRVPANDLRRKVIPATQPTPRLSRRRRYGRVTKEDGITAAALSSRNSKPKKRPVAARNEELISPNSVVRTRS